MAGKNRQIERLAQFFRVFGDPTRLQIVTALSSGELNVTQLCRKLRVTQPTISRHLGILRMSSIAEARRDGKEIFYTIPTPKRRVVKLLIERGIGLVK